MQLLWRNGVADAFSIRIQWVTSLFRFDVEVNAVKLKVDQKISFMADNIIYEAWQKNSRNSHSVMGLHYSAVSSSKSLLKVSNNILMLMKFYYLIPNCPMTTTWSIIVLPWFLDVHDLSLVSPRPETKTIANHNHHAYVFSVLTICSIQG